ncbi:rhodanese-like domain-containing protein [Candidatus Skiveiella danica]|jgi:rhodanese-related sulfurtransferase|uniref:rhodanese-like domain-containing protein n=1 Tax=Candidatus Skiveiella danica TaxID=3386177 RepID=UPI0039B8585A
MPRLQMPRRLVAVLASSLLVVSSLALAAPDDAAVKILEDYLEFVDYGGATIFPEQIPAADWKRFTVIDARDKAQFDKEHIAGAVNIEWRRVLAERKQIPKDKPVLLYCNTGTLSAQAGFALRVAGYENVRILQGGYAEWKAKGGFEANARAAGQSPRH